MMRQVWTLVVLLAFIATANFARASSQCSVLGDVCGSDSPCCEQAHDCFAGKCEVAVYVPAHGEPCDENCEKACSSRGESCVRGRCMGPSEDCSSEGEECNVEKGCCDPSHDCVPISDAPLPPIWERAGVCQKSKAAATGDRCNNDTPCRFRFDTCIDGVCQVSPAGLVDVSQLTGVAVTATAFDPRPEAEGGCGKKLGCAAGRTRDGKQKATSRWSCSEKLGKGKCALVFQFETPQDVHSLRMSFHEGDRNSHNIKVIADGREVKTFKTGKTLDFQGWDIGTKSVTRLRLEAVDLNPLYWIHVTEVELLARNTLTC